MYSTAMELRGARRANIKDEHRWRLDTTRKWQSSKRPTGERRPPSQQLFPRRGSNGEGKGIPGLRAVAAVAYEMRRALIVHADAYRQVAIAEEDVGWAREEAQRIKRVSSRAGNRKMSRPAERQP